MNRGKRNARLLPHILLWTVTNWLQIRGDGCKCHCSRGNIEREVDEFKWERVESWQLKINFVSFQFKSLQKVQIESICHLLARYVHLTTGTPRFIVLRSATSSHRISWCHLINIQEGRQKWILFLANDFDCGTTGSSSLFLALHFHYYSSSSSQWQSQSVTLCCSGINKLRRESESGERVLFHSNQKDNEMLSNGNIVSITNCNELRMPYSCPMWNIISQPEEKWWTTESRWFDEHFVPNGAISDSHFIIRNRSMTVIFIFAGEHHLGHIEERVK